MNTSPCPRLDDVIRRLRQLPEIEALLEYGFNGEPQLQAPPIYVPGLTDVSLIIQLQAQAAVYFMRLNYVAGGTVVSARAMRTIEVSVTIDEVRDIRAEYTKAPVINLNPRMDQIADVVNAIMERLLLSDDQFQQTIELAWAIGRHLRDKRRFL